MTPKQHFRALQIRLEIAEFGMGMPLDRERVKELREQVEQARIDTIVTHAWEIWTKNGLGLDDEDRRETEKTVQDAVNNEYQDDISDTDWLAATLLRLRGRKDADEYPSDEELQAARADLYGRE